jgi:hypothetical protein
VIEVPGTPGPPRFSSVAAAGELNSDGRADLVAGAPLSAYEGRDRSGLALLLFSP